MPVLELKGVSKSFFGVRVLDKVDFTLEKGEVHALLGENGAGKSTLIKVIAGVHHADEGEMYYDGKRVHFDKPIDAIHAGIGVVHQEISVFPDLSVAENLYVGHHKVKGALKAVDFAAMKKGAVEIFQRLGVDIDINQKAAGLSVAQRQMLVIAKALLFDSKIIIMDEPTAALSLSEVKTLFKIIEDLRNRGISIIYISHRMEELFQIADRVSVSENGKHVATALMSEVDSNQLIRWMVGRDITNFYPRVEHTIGDVVFEVKNLSDGKMVKDVSFALRQGEILGISGLAGAGRTESARAIVGLSKKTSGEIFMNGKELTIKNYRSAIEQGIVYISEDRQGDGLVLPMSIKDNITLSSLFRISNHGFINRKEDVAKATEFMNRLRVAAPDYNFEVKNLSGGNQQKVSLSKGLCNDPKIIILDEPTRGVDVGAKTEVYNLINELVLNGYSVIMISSDLPEIIGISDRVVVLKNGFTVSEAVGDKINQEYILSCAIGT